MKYETKLALQIFTLGIIILLIGFFVIYRFNYNNSLQHELQYTTSLVDEVSVNFEQRLLEKAKTNQTFSITPIFRTALNESNNTYSSLSKKERSEKINLQNEKWKAIDDENNAFILEFTDNSVAHFLKEQQNNLRGEYGEIFLTNKYGVIIASTAKLTTLAHAHKYWWKGAFNKGDGAVFFDDRGYDDSVGGYVLGMVIPIKENGEIIGILKVNLNILGAVSEMILSSQNDDTGIFKLIRSGGEIIFENGSAPLSNRIPDLLYEKIQVGHDQSLILKDTVNEWLIGMSEIKITSNNAEGYFFGGSFESTDHKKGNTGESWYVINYRSLPIVLKPLKNTTLKFLSIGFLFIIILAFAAFIFGKLTVKPLKQLIIQSDKIAKADFSTRIVVKRKDEIGLLGNAFNEMAEELEKTTTSIKNLEAEMKQRILAEDALKESEEKFRTVFKDSKSIELLINPETKKIIDANHVACEFYGYSYQILTSMSISEINQLPDIEMSAKMQKAKTRVNHFEFKHKLSNGVVKDVEVYSNPLKINNETILFLIVHDITDRKKAEHALKKSEAKLRESNATKDKFFSIIAHDLKSPFNSMLGFSKILNKKFDRYNTEKQKQFIGIIHNSIQNTYQLLDDLLLWSRSQKGSINFKPEKINLYLLSSGTIEVLEQSAENKSITLKNEIPEDVFVKADNNMLSIIIRNLISNAIKFTPKEGEITIKSHLITDKSNQKFTEITVKDNGVGISKEIQPKLFDIGENTSSEGTENERGTGLGLILCKEFVEKHGGKIRVESEVGNGSEFIFTLPV